MFVDGGPNSHESSLIGQETCRGLEYLETDHRYSVKQCIVGEIIASGSGISDLHDVMCLPVHVGCEQWLVSSLFAGSTDFHP